MARVRLAKGGGVMETERVLDVEDRLQNAKAALSLMVFVTNALGEHGGNFSRHAGEIDGWAWHRLHEVCLDGYRDLEAIYAALPDMRMKAPDVEVK